MTSQAGDPTEVSKREVTVQLDVPARMRDGVTLRANVLAGHRLRVQVTSSSFPGWDRNLNTGNQRGSRHQIARQRIHHEVEHPSYLQLPVIDSAR